MAQVVELTDSSFKEATGEGTGAVLVHFWAEWAGPCKMMIPLLEESAAAYEGRLTVAQLNIDRHPATAPQHQVKSIPTLLLLRNGRETGRRIGAQSRGQLKEFLDTNL
ncbi:thioredoxin [Streptomyces murinus]|uniref:thioredoxin n=1 Tax=Streptomyces murinus TaxID=33900 RepID=UPI00380E645A